MRYEEYDKRITELKALRDQLNSDRIQEQKYREKEIEAEQQRIQQQWREHEKYVESIIKNLSHKFEIDYIEKEKLPFNANLIMRYE